MLVNHGGIATQPRAPGHERPCAALRAARHGRLSAASTAPGADVPPATTAGAPGQYCLSAALRAPGHGIPLAIAAEAPCRDRLSAALRAPGADLLLASTAKAAGQHRPSAAPLATVSSPAGQHRLRQEGLPRVPANPRTLTCPPAHRDTTYNHATHPPPSQPSFPRTREPPSPRRNGGTTGGPAPVHPPSASCHPGPAPPAVLLHRGHGLPTPPLPRTPAVARPRYSPSLLGRGPGGRSAPSAARAAPPCAPRATTDSRPAPSLRRCEPCVHRPVRACPPPAS